MRPTKTILFSIVAITLLSGCMRQVAKVSPSVTREIPRGVPTYYEKDNFFFWGFNQVDTGQDLYKVCVGKDGIAFIETERTAFDVFLTLITIGMYSPSTMNIYCVDEQGLN